VNWTDSLVIARPIESKEKGGVSKRKRKRTQDLKIVSFFLGKSPLAGRPGPNRWERKKEKKKRQGKGEKKKKKKCGGRGDWRT